MPSRIRCAVSPCAASPCAVASRNASPRRLLSLALALAWTAAAGKSGAVEPEWLPLQPGNHWIYEIHRDHSYAPSNAAIDRYFWKGRSRETVSAGDGPPGTLRLVEVRSLFRIDAGVSEESILLQHLSFSDALLLHASGRVAREIDRPPETYEPPLRMLPSVEPGASWKVGTVRDGPMRLELRGEVVGFEEIADPPCSKCLLVRYRGSASGTIPVFEGAAEIESGTLERSIWLQRGVGIVREVARSESRLRLPDGTQATTSEVTTRRLVEHQLAAPVE